MEESSTIAGSPLNVVLWSTTGGNHRRCRHISYFHRRKVGRPVFPRSFILAHTNVRPKIRPLIVRGQKICQFFSSKSLSCVYIWILLLMIVSLVCSPHTITSYFEDYTRCWNFIPNPCQYVIYLKRLLPASQNQK